MMILVCFYALEMILKTFLKEELWKILFTFPHPIKKKRGYSWTTLGKCFFHVIHFSSIGIEAVTILSWFVRTNERDKGQNKDGAIQCSWWKGWSSGLILTWILLLALVLSSCHFPAHMLRLSISNSNLAFGSGNFYC